MFDFLTKKFTLKKSFSLLALCLFFVFACFVLLIHVFCLSLPPFPHRLWRRRILPNPKKKGGDKLTLSVSGPTNTTPIITNSVLKTPKLTENLESDQKRCATPVTVTFFGQSDRGKLEKVVLDSKKQPLSLLSNSSDVDCTENEPSSLSPGGRSLKSPADVKGKNRDVFFADSVSSNPFAKYMTETNPFHDSNPFNPSNPFRSEENNGTSDGVSEEDSLSSNKEVSVACVLFLSSFSTLCFTI